MKMLPVSSNLEETGSKILLTNYEHIPEVYHEKRGGTPAHRAESLRKIFYNIMMFTL